MFGRDETAVKRSFGRSDIQGKVLEHGRQRIGHQQPQRVVAVWRQTPDGLVQQEQLRTSRAERREPVADHQTQESNMTTQMRGPVVPGDRQQPEIPVAVDAKIA